MAKRYTDEDRAHVMLFIKGEVEKLPDGRNPEAVVRAFSELFDELKYTFTKTIAANHALSAPLLREAAQKPFIKDHALIDWINDQRKLVLCIGGVGLGPLHAECRRRLWEVVSEQAAS